MINHVQNGGPDLRSLEGPILGARNGWAGRWLITLGGEASKENWSHGQDTLLS